jgi:hypothetical protein
VSSRDFLFDVDLLLVARQLGFRVAEVPTVWVDQSGSRLHGGQESLRMAASALRLWLHHRLLPVDGAEPEGTTVEALNDVIDLQEVRRVSA